MHTNVWLAPNLYCRNGGQGVVPCYMGVDRDVGDTRLNNNSRIDLAGKSDREQYAPRRYWCLGVG
jgi:hypothetical protein